MSKKREIDICICTFQRPHITETLQSIAKMNIHDDVAVRVIIADNDETPSSQARVEENAKALPFPLVYIHAPARNISIARNACLDAAKANLVIFIDDDEVVDKNWLNAFLDRMDQTGADALIGPVKAIYLPSCPQWIIDGDFHSREAVYKNGEVVTGYTANLIFDQTAKAFKGKRFRVELGQSGGEDSCFLKEAYEAGAKLEYAPDAIVSETIPEERTKLKWLLKRRFREGQTHGMMLNEANAEGNSAFARIKNTAVALSKSLVSYAAAPVFFWNKPRMNFWLLRGTMHIGVVAYLLGRSKLVLYGHDQNEHSQESSN